MTIDLTKLNDLAPLARGAHEADGIACVMEAVAYVAGEKWSDHPECACPVISAFLRNWNDNLSDDERDTLLRPLVSEMVGTRSTKAIERKRAVMAGDWLIRSHTPAWLRLAGLSTQAEALEASLEITDFKQCPSLMPVLNAVRKDAAAAAAAAGAAAGAAAWAAAWAAGDAAWAAAWAAAGAAAGAAAAAAAWDAAGDAAWDAAWAALSKTKRDLQQSALDLVRRMIAVKE